MVYCFLAEGFEEMEAIVPIDILRRGEVDVQIVGVGEDIITGAHGISVYTDLTAQEITLDDTVEMIILPGGMPGTLNLEANKYVQAAIDFCAAKGKYIAAICAAPSILGHKGLLKGREAICFPGYESQLEGAVISEKPVVTDGNIITAKSAGTAREFGIELIKTLKGEGKARKIQDSLQCS